MEYLMREPNAIVRKYFNIYPKREGKHWKGRTYYPKS